MNNEPVAWQHKVAESWVTTTKDGDDNEWIPLYTHPAKTLTDEEIEEVWIQALKDEPKVNAGKFPSLANQPFVFFARAILRKAQEK